MITRKKFTGKLRSDFDFALLQDQDWTNARNVQVEVSRLGEKGLLKPFEGNREIEFTWTNDDSSIEGLTGDYDCIGGAEDFENRRYVYFLRSKDGQEDFVLLYEKDTEAIKIILRDSQFSDDGLNFQEGFLITGVAFHKSMMFWTDNYNEPRRINVDRALLTEQSGHTNPYGEILDPYPDTLTQQSISIIRMPPIFPPNAVPYVSEDTSFLDDITGNNIDKTAWQFAHRYTYIDGEQSVFSEWSKVVNPLENEDVIRVTLSTQEQIGDEIIEIDLAMREYGTNNWYILKTWRRASDSTEIDNHNLGTPLTFDFTGLQYGNAIAAERVIKPFDSVPLKAKALEVARNRVALLNCTEGYDAPDQFTFVPITATIIEGQIGDGIEAEYYHAKIVCPDETVNVTFILISGSGLPGVDGWYFFSFNYSISEYQNGGLPPLVTLTSSNYLGSQATYPGVIDLFPLYSPCGSNWSVLESVVSTPFNFFQDVIVFGLDGSSLIEEGVQIFKDGAAYQIGIVYYDNYGRRYPNVLTNDDLVVNTEPRIFNQTTYPVGISWNLPAGVQTQIPVWATHYQIVITKNQTTQSFVSHFSSVFRYVSIDSDGIYTYETDYNGGQDRAGISIDTTWLIQDGKGYTFNDGDICRLFPNDDGVYIDLAVIGVDGKWIICELTDLGNPLDSTNPFENFMFEVFTPYALSDAETFYGTGEVFTITNAGLGTRSFSVVSGVIKGDCYYQDIFTTSIAGNTVWAMNHRDSEWFNWPRNLGRPYIALPTTKQVVEGTGMKWSNVALAGLKYQGHSSFDALDSEIFDYRLGAIQKVVLTGRGQAEGSVLLIIGSASSASLYLGETQLLDNSAETFLATLGRCNKREVSSILCRRRPRLL